MGLKKFLMDKTPSNLIQKGNIQKIVEDGMFFVDGSFETVDTLIFCTGKTRIYFIILLS